MDSYIGWDVGGAHLKMAVINSSGQIVSASQYAVPLWQGIGELGASLQLARNRLPEKRQLHAVTTTGELVDIFPDRKQGVMAISNCLAQAFRNETIQYYAGCNSWLKGQSVASQYQEIASANWHATASLVASVLERGILLDIGSTTTDIIAFNQNQLLNSGYSDFERLAHAELVYTGVTRTPVMAIADNVILDGRSHPLVAEVFATMADVYRLLGLLEDTDDMFPAADRAGKSIVDSARRLARMTGQDIKEDNNIHNWQKAAAILADKQKLRISRSLEKVMQKTGLHDNITIVGAGAGRFLAKSIAQDMQLTYLEFAELLGIDGSLRAEVSRAAPAVSVALLARQCA